MTRPREPRQPLLPKIDDAPGPMPPLSAAEADAIAWGAVSRWAARPPGLEPIDDSAGPSQPLAVVDAERLARRALRVHARRRAQPWALRAAAAALCLCGVAGVALAAYRLWPTPPALATSVAASPIGRQPSAATPPSSTPAVPSEPATSPTVKPQTKPAAASVGPEELLARANALRAQRRWLAAETGYRKLLTAGASEPQRYVALVAAAALALQHLDKPARALSHYQAALDLIPDGNLSEEALFGVAECQRALADPVAELQALQRLCEKHPNGLFSAAARRRLAELESAAQRAQDQ